MCPRQVGSRRLGEEVERREYTKDGVLSENRLAHSNKTRRVPTRDVELPEIMLTFRRSI